MERSEAIRLLTAHFNYNIKLERDEFSGDYLLDLKQGENLLDFMEKLGMLPPTKEGVVKLQEDDGQLVLPLWGWDEE